MKINKNMIFNAFKKSLKEKTLNSVCQIVTTVSWDIAQLYKCVCWTVRSSSCKKILWSFCHQLILSALSREYYVLKSILSINSSKINLTTLSEQAGYWEVAAPTRGPPRMTDHILNAIPHSCLHLLLTGVINYVVWIYSCCFTARSGCRTRSDCKQARSHTA